MLSTDGRFDQVKVALTFKAYAGIITVTISEVKVYCPRCHTEKPRSHYHLCTGRPNGLQAYCWPCTQNYHKTRNATLPAFLSTLWYSSKKSAKVRGGTRAEHTISKADLVGLWEQQHGLCYYTGMIMSHVPGTPWTASLERVDPKLGYVPGNVVLVVLELNTSRQWSQAKLISLLKQLDTKEIDEKGEAKLIADIQAAKVEPESTRIRGERVCVPKHRPVRVGEDGVVYHLCTICGIHKPRAEFAANVNDRCKQCAKDAFARWLGTIRGHVMSRLNAAKQHAKDMDKAIRSGKRTGEAGFSLELKPMLDLLIQQQGLCKYSDVRLQFGQNIDCMASIERIDSSKGYHPDNVVWVCWEFNVSEHSAGQVATEGLDRAKVQTLLACARAKYSTL